MVSIYSQEYQALLKQLKRARLLAGMSQAQVARLLKKPQSYVSKCESGERRVDFIELQQFARIYKKKLTFFGRYPS